MEGSPGDLQTKYHKIAGEYSKCRAQITVLKQAIVEEKELNKELKQSFREAEQRLRKADQETDSLLFRNEQLTRRVTVLQDELDSMQNKSKKSKVKPQDGQQQDDFSKHVIDEEFRKKIQENAQLLSQMSEKEDKHQQELTRIISQHDQMSFELTQIRKASIESEGKSKSMITKLERELSCLREGQTHLTDVSQELAQLRQAYADYRDKMDTKVANLSKIISSHLPFVDSRVSSLGTLNVPPVISTRDNLESGKGEELRASLQQMAASLALWHKVVEARLQKLPTANSVINAKYSEHLKETYELAMELERNLSPSKICKSIVQKLPGQFASYCGHVESMLLHLKLSLEEEEIDNGNENLRDCNRGYLGNCSQLVSHLVQINSRVTLYKSTRHIAEVQYKYQRGLINITTLVQESFKDLFNCFVLKAGLETENNLVTEELNAANQSVINSLSSLLESSTKVSNCLREFWKVADSIPPPHPLVSDLRRRGVHYISSINYDESSSIPYIHALKNHEEAQNSIKMREMLINQLEENTKQLRQIEQDSEVWREELQLLKLKYEKEEKDNNKSDEYTNLVNSTVTNMIGSLEVPVNLHQEVSAREESIKNYFRQRVNKQISENGELKSKCVVLLAEINALTRRLEDNVSRGAKLEEVLQEARDRSAQLQEEVKTTVGNYETQLSTMSEHLANMNEKLAQQKETIDQLEYQITHKRKGKK